MENSKLKVCIFCRYFYPSVGGNETQALLLAKELVAQGVAVMVIAARINKTYKREEVYKGIKIYRVGELSSLIKNVKQVITMLRLFGRSKVVSQVDNGIKVQSASRLSVLSDFINISYFKFNALRKLRLENKNYDLIHSQMLGQIGYIALRGALNNNKPILIKDATLGGLELVNVGLYINRQRKLLRDNANFVAISTQIYNNLISQGIDKNRIFRISNGIDIRNVEKNNLEATPYTLLYVGNYWQGAIKGLDLLLRAMGEVLARHHRVRLSIAGSGDVEYYKNIAREAGALDHVDFCGSVKDMDLMYRSHSIFILPSRSEGMSNATLEAMSYGMPCVVSDVSGSMDQIENGKEGLIVPIDNSHAIAVAVIELLDNPIKARLMGDAAKEKIRQIFDIRITTVEHIKVYKKITNRVKS